MFFKMKSLNWRGFTGRATLALENQRFCMLLIAVASAVVLYCTEYYELWGDLDHYYANAGDVLDGKMPYSMFQFEYPPVSLLFMLIPRIFTWNLNSFHYGCAILTYVFFILGSYFLIRTADKCIGCRWQTNLYLLCTVIFGSYFVIARNDVYPTVMVIISLWCYLNRRFIPAFVIMSLAALTKLYPALFLPLMIIPFILKKDWRNFGVALVLVAVTGIIVESPFILTDPSTAFAYLTYHSDRGIQVESVASSFFMVFNLFFPEDLGVVFNYGSDNITGVGPDLISPYMDDIMWVVLISFFVWMLFRTAKVNLDKERIMATIGLMCVTMLMLFIAFSKVYSAQYYIWIVLLLPFTQFSYFSKHYRREICLLFIPFALFTMASYLGYMWFGLMRLDSFAICLTAMKNVLHILLLLVLLCMCYHETRPSLGGVKEPLVGQ